MTVGDLIAYLNNFRKDWTVILFDESNGTETGEDIVKVGVEATKTIGENSSGLEHYALVEPVRGQWTVVIYS